METAVNFFALLVLGLSVGSSVKACHLLLQVTQPQQGVAERGTAKLLLGITYGLFVLGVLAIILEASF